MKLYICDHFFKVYMFSKIQWAWGLDIWYLMNLILSYLNQSIVEGKKKEIQEFHIQLYAFLRITQ